MTASAAQALALQLAIAATTLAFGVLALRVGGDPERSPRCSAWFLAGVAFTVDGAISSVHNTAAVVAVLCGPGSAFYDGFLRMLPPGNDARGVLMLGFALALVALVLRRRPAIRPRTAVLWALTFTAAGFGAGLAEPPVRAGESVHFTVLGVVDAASVILLFAALYRGLVRECIDWLLWVALAVYAVQQALASNVVVLLASAGAAGSWAPPAATLHWTGLASLLLMLLCTARRLELARSGRDAPALMERLRG